jgi:drug/metabolite transporter (DMT)-like permease
MTELSERLPETPPPSAAARGAMLVLFGAAAFGLHTTTVKYAFSLGANAAQVMFWEFFLAAGILAVLAAPVLRQSVKLPPRQIRKVAFWGAAGAGGTALALYLALERLPVALSVTLLFQYLPWLFLLERVIHRKRPTRRQWLALGLVWGGTFLAAGLQREDWLAAGPAGVAFGLLSAVCYGTFLFKFRELGTIGTPVFRSLVMCATVAALCAVVGLVAGLPMFALSSPQLGLLVAVLLVTTMLGQVIPLFAFSKGVPLAGAALAGIVASIELPVATVFSFVALGEVVAGPRWLGVALIAAAVALANLPERRRRV